MSNYFKITAKFMKNFTILDSLIREIQFAELITDFFFFLKEIFFFFFDSNMYTNFKPFLFIKVLFFIRIKYIQDIFFHLGIRIKPFDLLGEQLYTSFTCFIFILHFSNIRRQRRLNPDCIENNCLFIFEFFMSNFFGCKI